MNTTIGQRLKIFLEFKGHKVTQLADALGYSNAEKLNRLFRDKDARPGYDTIMDIANHYPDLNIEWFLKGEGEMRTVGKTFPALASGKLSVPEDTAMINAIKKSNLPCQQKFDMALELLRVYAHQVERLQAEMEIKNKLLLLNAQGRKK
ncbi:MAG: helix-turn-helix transcriptional regulator [Dinghuibacter sp.]|nr:helix-turn-helix transcriptional regulator [Dinghuibacter sp.]